MDLKEALPAAAGYAAWLSQTRHAISEQQQSVRFVFSADNSAASFNKISYATCKILPAVATQE